MKATRLALIGNPNAGKSSIFNLLTGLRQKTANFPGVTVEKKTGSFHLGSHDIRVTDLPGTYSLFPNSKDEKLVCQVLCNPENDSFPDLVVYVTDVNQLERHLLLATQIIDLGIPVIVVLNMMDVFTENGNRLDTQALHHFLGVPVIGMNARSGDGLDNLKQEIQFFVEGQDDRFLRNYPIYNFSDLEDDAARISAEILPVVPNSYRRKLIAHHHQWMDFLSPAAHQNLSTRLKDIGFEDIRTQIQETMRRFALIQDALRGVVETSASRDQKFSISLDGILTHKLWGPLFFFTLMFVIFQSIFWLAEYPMDWIESSFSFIGSKARLWLEPSWMTDLLVDGLLAGLSGVLVFAPQIVILFFFLSLLEESGYMSRVVYMFDHIMQKFGLNGRSMVSLISSGACAIPAIMSTRTIGSWKERLITIMVAPLIPCSARIPVYTVLIALMVPAHLHHGPFNVQGLVFMALYLMGIVASLLVALMLKWIIKSDERSFLMLELPSYKKPIWSNVGLEVWDKLLAFVTNAGKVIVFISLGLWFLASYGPGNDIEQAALVEENKAMVQNISEQQKVINIQSAKLEASYAGQMGKWMEPAIAPLGFDWKIGIALVTSFAAREVFVGTMATIYSIGGDAEESSVRDRMAAELRQGTTQPMYGTATSMSLLVFYAFALQCMSTLAITKKETNSWKWPAIQFILMTSLAYLGSWLTFHLLS
jgi:ferrous iron transport protein B